MAESSEYTFMAELHDERLVLAHSDGGGTRFFTDEMDRDELVEAVGNYMATIAREFAEEIVDELLDEAGDSEEVGDR